MLELPIPHCLNFSKVKNVPNTLELMAKNLRKRSKSKFIAVTGSVGKTGTKDMMEKCFAKFGLPNWSPRDNRRKYYN